MTQLDECSPGILEAAEPNNGRRLSDRQRFFLGVVGLTSFAVLLLSVLRITTSSLILHGGTGEPNSARLIAGVPRGIRADEWNRSTPDLLGSLSRGWNPDYKSVFEIRVARSGLLESSADFLQSPEQFFGRLVLSANAFFTLWWLPIALAFISLVGLYLLWGFGKLASIVSALVVVLIPTTSWWSYHPMQIVWPLVTAFLLVEAARRLQNANDLPSFVIAQPGVRKVITYLLPVLGGLLVSRIPFGYLPWVLPAAIIFFLMVIDWMLWKEVFKNGLRSYAIGLIALVIAVSFKGLVWLNRYQTLAGTVYPGARRSAGGDLRQPIFTGAQAGFLQFSAGDNLVGTNQSEAALGPLVLIAIVVLLVVYGATRFGAHTLVHSGVPILSLGAVAVLGAWAFIPWPSILVQANPLTLIPAYRLSQIVGVVAVVPATLALVRLMELFSLRDRCSIAITATIFALAVSVSSGVSLSEFMPGLSIDQIWLTSILFSGSVGIAIAFSARAFFLIPLLCFVAVSSFRINPIVQGLGDLRDSRVASDLRASVRPSNSSQRVATDDFTLDALASANGLPMASGQVFWGPNDEVWHLLDPSDTYVNAWNRGASSLRFDWQGDTDPAEIWSPTDDMIVVTIGPCRQELKELGVEWIISSRPLENNCVNEISQFRWMDGDRWLYKLS